MGLISEWNVSTGTEQQRASMLSKKRMECWSCITQKVCFFFIFAVAPFILPSCLLSNISQFYTQKIVTFLQFGWIGVVSAMARRTSQVCTLTQLK